MITNVSFLRAFAQELQDVRSRDGLESWNTEPGNRFLTAVANLELVVGKIWFGRFINRTWTPHMLPRSDCGTIVATPKKWALPGSYEAFQLSKADDCFAVLCGSMIPKDAVCEHNQMLQVILNVVSHCLVLDMALAWFFCLTCSLAALENPNATIVTALLFAVVYSFSRMVAPVAGSCKDRFFLFHSLIRHVPYPFGSSRNVSVVPWTKWQWMLMRLQNVSYATSHMGRLILVSLVVWGGFCLMTGDFQWFFFSFSVGILCLVYVTGRSIRGDAICEEHYFSSFDKSLELLARADYIYDWCSSACLKDRETLEVVVEYAELMRQYGLDPSNADIDAFSVGILRSNNVEVTFPTDQEEGEQKVAHLS